MSNSEKDFERANQKRMDSAGVKRNHAIQKPLSFIQNKYLVTSNKRGVGKTSLSANLSVTLSKKGKKVGLIDLDFDGMDISRILGLKGNHKIDEDNLYIPQPYSDNLQVISVESILKDVDQTAAQGEELKTHVVRRCIANVNWGEIDYLIVDFPPGTGPELKAAAQMIQDGEIILVSTPQPESLTEIEKLIQFYNNLEMTVWGIIENNSGIFCSECDKTGDSTLTESVIMEIDYLGRIPTAIDRMSKCIEAGESFLEKYPDSEAAHGYNVIAEKIIGRCR